MYQQCLFLLHRDNDTNTSANRNDIHNTRLFTTFDTKIIDKHIVKTTVMVVTTILN